MNSTPPDNPIPETEENVLPVPMDEPVRPFVKNFGDFMYYFVHFGFVIIIWSMAWVAISALTQKMGFASPFAMRVVWSLPLLGILGTILSGYYPLGWVISTLIIAFGLLGLSLAVAGLFGLYSEILRPA
jgi:hypothetical protein